MIDCFLRGASMEIKKRPTACVLIIGNEILSGRTQDVNVVTISRWLNEIGVLLEEVRVVPDIVNAFAKHGITLLSNAIVTHNEIHTISELISIDPIQSCIPFFGVAT